MKLFRFTDPVDEHFARASRIGTWKETSQKPCLMCGNPRAKREKPLVIEWEPGSSVVGDFTWPGYDDCIAATEKTLELIKARFGRFALGPIKMVPNSTSRRKASVSLPYQGTPLFELWVDDYVSADHHHSSIEVTVCQKCGHSSYEISNVEHWTSEYDPINKQLVKTRISRQDGQGIYIRFDALRGRDVFRISEFPAWIFCTERVRDFIENLNLNNIDFAEMGEVMK